jgi:A/G-specific adenine glycosylase
VWISEIMLQQTRVAAVVPYYERWMARFPSAAALAEAPMDDVLSAWSGLGYYARARNLKRAAEIVRASGGAMPDEVDALRALPGIGRYTAGAIASIAFGRRVPLVDGNVARVLARVFAIEDDVKSVTGQRQLWQLAEELVPAEAPGDFNQGLMELGATVCAPAAPRCAACPLRSMCRAAASGRQGELPRVGARLAREAKPWRRTAAAWIERGGELLLGRRRPGGLFGGLWELPQADDRRALATALGAKLGGRAIGQLEQELSHLRLRIALYRGERIARAPEPFGDYDHLGWQPQAHLARLGLSMATRVLVARHKEEASWKSTRRPSARSATGTTRSSRD